MKYSNIEVSTIRTTRRDAGDRLKRLFESANEGNLALRVFTPRHCFVFDFDGVLLEECGIAEFGYAWLTRAVRDDNWNARDLEVSDLDRREATAFRPTLKGKSPLEKVEILQSRFGASDRLPFPAVDVVGMWFAALSEEIRRRFGSEATSYLLPGSEEFVRCADQLGCAYGLTANIQKQAEFLMGFVGLQSLFRMIVGYPADARAGVSKATMLMDLLSSQGILPDDTCYIGDGVPDMRAAHQAGVLAVGIANDPDGGMRLISEGCDILATSSVCGETLTRLLANRISG